MRQEVLVLYLSNSSLDSAVVAWSRFNGADDEASEVGDEPERPYETGLDALRDGWRLFQAAQLVPSDPGAEYATSFQKFEFWFERMVEPVGRGQAAGGS
ncbi:MAG: hypothetical protein J2O39_00605 [Acidimicrobiales bacterium]|nr:hypothetical protein [Acidimicrobiales bacterium]